MQVWARVDPTYRKWIERHAVAEFRAISNMVEVLIIEAIKPRERRQDA